MDELYFRNQPILNKLGNNIVNNLNYCQAYILVSENQELLKNYSIELSKMLICPKKFSKNCLKCNICKRIDDKNYSELVEINPINNIIKKQEIINVREKFNKYSMEGKSQVYIINNIEFLGQSAANSILKFLEEPDSNTVAIFTTANLSKVLETIKSRCQIIKLNNLSYKTGKDYILDFCNCSSENLEKYLQVIYLINQESNLSLIYLKTTFKELFQSKEDLTILLKIMILLYKDCINYLINDNFEYFDKNDNIMQVVTKENINLISKKITLLLNLNEELMYNVNINLFLDNLIIRMGELNND